MPENMLTETQLQALLRLKRHEQPPPGYFDSLLTSIHRRQREEMLRRPAWQIAFDRVRAFFVPQRIDWAHAASMAVLLVVGVAAIRVALPDRVSQGAQFAAVSDQRGGHSLAVAGKTEQLLTLEPRVGNALATVADRQNSGNHLVTDEDAPTRFVIDTQPVSYETKQFRF